MWPKAWADVMDLADLDGMSQEWEEGLAGLTGEEIKTGLEVARATRTWPPAIAEFRKDCRPPDVHKSAAYRICDPSRLLTKATREDTEELAAGAFAKMRQALRT